MGMCRIVPDTVHLQSESFTRLLDQVVVHCFSWL